MNLNTEQRQILCEALLDNVRERGTNQVHQFIESISDGDRKEIIFPYCSSGEDATIDGIRHRLKTDVFLLHEACAADKYETFTLLVNYGLRYDVNINATNNEDLSILEYATQLGRIKFVKWLEYRVGLDNLLSASKSLQKLVGIGCKAGQRQMVDYWITRMTERLKRPPGADDFISGLDPVTQAFLGGHEELACEMFARNMVRITESMCVQTRGFLSKRLDELVELVEQEYSDHDDENECEEEEENEVHRAHWHRRNIWYFDRTWLQSPTIQCTSLRTIDLGYNHLESIPEQLLWCLPHLRYLRVNNNEINTLPVPPSWTSFNIERLSLIELDLSHNQLQDVPVDVFRFPYLETINLSSNNITRLPVDVESDSPSVLAERCRSLTKLDVSFNKLGMLPLWITRSAMKLRMLNISNNEMEGLLPSWKCNLMELDASHNFISGMAVCDFHTHWAHSLTSLNLSKNDFHEIPPTVCRLTLLENLDLSRNSIATMPSEDQLWTTRHLKKVNLSNNRLRCNYYVDEDGPKNAARYLSAPKWKTGTIYSDLVFPKVFHNSVKELYLGSNELHSVPPSICEMICLEVLDISGNQNITKLPYSLCQLRSLTSLRLDGTSIRSPNDIVPYLTNPAKLLQTLREKYENCKPYHTVKVVVAGPRNSGKTTVVRKLFGSEAPADGLDTGQAIDIVGRTFKSQGITHSLPSLKEHSEANIDFNVWDLKGNESLGLIHRCCVTPNTVYLLVWDMNSDVNEIEKLLPWWFTIQSIAPNSPVILVGTHRYSTRRKQTTMTQHIESLEDNIENKFGRDMRVIYVDSEATSSKKAGYQLLQVCLRNCVKEMKYKCRGNKYFLQELKVPETFLLLKDHIARERSKMVECAERPHILPGTNLQQFARTIPNTCLKNEEDWQEVLDFLTYTGSLINVSDRKYGIGRLYFPNPSWLCDVLKSVTDLKQSDLPETGRISLEHLKELCRTSGFGVDNFREYEQLLKSFEIIMPSAEDKTTYWIPCKLPAEKPGMEFISSSHEGGEPKQLRRVYLLPYIPPGFWSRLVSRIISSVEQMNRDRNLQSTRSRALSCTSQTTIPRTQSMDSMSGLGSSVNGNNVYWQTGILVFHDTGTLLVEDLATTAFTTSFTRHKETRGVSITIKCRLGRFNIMGLVVDQVENLISNWYPDLAYSQMHRLIPCPVCDERRYNRERSDSGCCRRGSIPLKLSSPHIFTVEELATKMCKHGEDSVECPSHPDSPMTMSSVLPEMFFGDLDVAILSPEQFQFRRKKRYKLGSGSFGDVYRGLYNGDEVAVKCFIKDVKPHASSVSLPVEQMSSGVVTYSGIGLSSNRSGSKSKGKIHHLKRRLSSLTEQPRNLLSGIATAGSSSSRSRYHRSHSSIDTRDIRGIVRGGYQNKVPESSTLSTGDPDVISSFSKLRSELAVMSRLKHPYIVGLKGVSLQLLCFAMDFTPHGDLRAFLQDKYDAMRDELPLGKHMEIQGTIVSRNLSFKIALQIAEGIAYLHSMEITHADLKPANVLVFSKDIKEPVNIKITDYGISRNMDRGGSKGRVGTLGFRAPEIGQDLIFGKEVDWFSYGRLLYQLMTGVSPSQHFQGESQLTEIDHDAERSRFSFVRYTMHTSCPNLVALMRACWRQNPQERPGDSCVLAALRTPGILALRHVVQLDSFACSCPMVATVAANSHDQETVTDHNIHVWTGGQLSARRRYQLICGDQGKPFAKAELHIGTQVKCVLQVGKYNILATTNGQVQVFECPVNTGTTLRLVRTLRMACPVQNMCFQEMDTTGSLSYLFVSLENGSLIVYDANPSICPDQWNCVRQIKIDAHSNPCNVLQYVRGRKEMWIACGGGTLRIVNTVDFTVTPDVISIGSDQQQQQSVGCIAGQGDKIWCSMKGSSDVNEYSTKNRELVRVIRCLTDHADYNEVVDDEVTALLVVKDTLWIGKNTGSVVVISIGDGGIAASEEMSVVGVLEVNKMVGKPRGQVTQLLRVGVDRTVACVHYKDDDGHDSGYLVIWETWGWSEFQRFQQYQHSAN